LKGYPVLVAMQRKGKGHKGKRRGKRRGNIAAYAAATEGYLFYLFNLYLKYIN
jgi:hypothetical protein